VLRVELDSDAQTAIAIVPDRHLSLAIGKEGQNARLAAKLTGWSIDIRSNVEADAKRDAATALAAAVAAIGDPATADIEALELPTRVLNLLKQGGLEKIGPLLVMSKEEILAIPGLGEKSYIQIQDRLNELGLLAKAAEAEAPEPDVAVVEAVADAVEELAAEAPETDAPTAPVVEAGASDEASAPAEAPVEEATAVVVPGVVLPEDVGQLMPEFEVEEVPELVPVMDAAPLLRDVAEDVWAIHRAGSPADTGQIRFAEDIDGLKGGVTARRGRTRDDADGGRKKKSRGAGSRRRR
jgi:hypothetical protein